MHNRWCSELCCENMNILQENVIEMKVETRPCSLWTAFLPISTIAFFSLKATWTFPFFSFSPGNLLNAHVIYQTRDLSDAFGHN
jgi:hypothetical protein